MFLPRRVLFQTTHMIAAMARKMTITTSGMRTVPMREVAGGHVEEAALSKVARACAVPEGWASM